MIFKNLFSAIGQIQCNNVKAQAVTTCSRCKTIADVPTLAELGLPDGGCWKRVSGFVKITQG